SFVAFCTNEGGRFEGFHKRPDSPLLIIVNEAKNIDANIWRGIDRCTPNALMLVSSPGGREGRFYQCFQELAGRYQCIRAGLKDCPHISKEKIDEIVAIYGENDPQTRSTLHGEFMQSPDGDMWVCLPEDYESCLDFPPEHKPGFKCGFFDFAEGRAENVFFRRDGNKYFLEDAWRETNEDAVVGRAIYLINRCGLK